MSHNQSKPLTRHSMPTALPRRRAFTRSFENRPSRQQDRLCLTRFLPPASPLSSSSSTAPATAARSSASTSIAGEVTIAAAQRQYRDRAHARSGEPRDRTPALCLSPRPSKRWSTTILEQTHGGWENNDGAYGEFTFDVAERTIKLDFNERISDIRILPSTCFEEATMATSLSPRPFHREEMGRLRRGLSAASTHWFDEVEEDHRRFPAPRAAPSRRGHLHAGALLRLDHHDLHGPRHPGPVDRRTACPSRILASSRPSPTGCAASGPNPGWAGRNRSIATSILLPPPAHHLLILHLEQPGLSIANRPGAFAFLEILHG